MFRNEATNAVRQDMQRILSIALHVVPDIGMPDLQVRNATDEEYVEAPLQISAVQQESGLVLPKGGDICYEREIVRPGYSHLAHVKAIEQV